MVDFAFPYVVLYTETARWMAVLIGNMVTPVSIKAMLQVLAVVVLHARKISSKL